MDDKNQKERLEQELRFLKESFEAEVISKEEFEKGRDRIERKLREIHGEEHEEIKTEEPEQNAVESKQPEKIKLKVIQDEPEEEHHEEPKKEVFKEQKKKSKFFRYASVFVVLLLVAYFSYSLIQNKPSGQDSSIESNFAAACVSDSDCSKNGKEGSCINPGEKEAKCDFKETPKTDILVLNDRNGCFNCDTSRVLSILESWFGPVNAREIDYSAQEGKNMAEKLGAKAMPSYILGENIAKNPEFEKFKNAFIKNNGNYILSDSAAAPAFYFRRDNIQNKLNFFILSGDSTSIRAEKNLKEFLDAFKSIKFEKHLQNDNLTKELGIRNFPVFLINNRIKFTGVQSAETIKENFCKVNKLPECNISLSRNLI